MDDRAPRHRLAVLEHELAARQVDDRLHAVPVRPDLHARGNAVELEADRHRLGWLATTPAAAVM